MDEAEPTYESLALLRSTPDPERDARRAAYRKREHARIVQAFDRFLSTPTCEVGLHQKAHYGVAPESDDLQ